MWKRAALIVGVGLLANLLPGISAVAAEIRKEQSGKDIAYDRSKGNCLACHAMPTLADAEQPGNSGPPLVAMSARYPDKARLRARIYDPTVGNPDTFMPPFGRHKVLTEAELDKVVEFVYGL